jgi:hypothetical protein
LARYHSELKYKLNSLQIINESSRVEPLSSRVERVNELRVFRLALEPMHTVRPSAHSGSKGISFTSFTGLKVMPTSSRRAVARPQPVVSLRVLA